MKNKILLILLSLIFSLTNVIASGRDSCITNNPGIVSADDIPFNNNMIDPIINPRIRVIIVDYQGNVIRESNTSKSMMPDGPELMRNILKRCDLIMEDSQSAYYLLTKNIESQSPENQHNKNYFKKTPI